MCRRRHNVDHGLTGTTRLRPGLREALAACRTGNTLVVTKLDRLARSLPDARDIVEELTALGVRLQLGGSVHDPTDPVGRLLFNVLAMVAEFSVIWTRRCVASFRRRWLRLQLGDISYERRRVTIRKLDDHPRGPAPRHVTSGS